ncbi:hypothetical protein [Nonomuraea maheshkhaliensis]|uniref:hypothetical protein n=1 Tax=Nonomuraea maheshkhaliensis TaxID=419590 RepID=UPI0031F9C6B9
MHVFDGAALGGDAAAPELQVKIFDVQGQDFVGSGCGLVQHAPQDPLAEIVPIVGEQLLQAGERDRSVAAAGGFAPLQPSSGVDGEDLLALRPGGEGGERGQVPVPGGDRRAVPSGHHRGVVVRGQGAGVAGTGVRGEAGESLGVAGPGGLGLDPVEVAVDSGRDALAALRGVRRRGVGGRRREGDGRHEDLRSVDVTHNVAESAPIHASPSWAFVRPSGPV